MLTPVTLLTWPLVAPKWSYTNAFLVLVDIVFFL